MAQSDADKTFDKVFKTQFQCNCKPDFDVRVICQPKSETWKNCPEKARFIYFSLYNGQIDLVVGKGKHPDKMGSFVDPDSLVKWWHSIKDDIQEFCEVDEDVMAKVLFLVVEDIKEVDQ